MVKPGLPSPPITMICYVTGIKCQTHRKTGNSLRWGTYVLGTKLSYETWCRGTNSSHLLGVYFRWLSLLKGMLTSIEFCIRIPVWFSSHRCECLCNYTQLQELLRSGSSGFDSVVDRWELSCHFWGWWSFSVFVVVLFYFLYIRSLDCFPTSTLDRDWGRNRKALPYQHVQHASKEAWGWRTGRGEEAYDFGTIQVWLFFFFFCLILFFKTRSC